jgi:hypothetical protein
MDVAEAASKRKGRSVRIWMLTSLPYTVAANGGDRGIAPSPQFSIAWSRLRRDSIRSAFSRGS